VADAPRPDTHGAQAGRSKIRPSPGRGRAGTGENRRELLEDVERGQRDILTIFASSAQMCRKIMDIFEGTQQIQQLIIARRLLGKTSAELK